VNGEGILGSAAVRERAPFLTAVWSHLLMVTFAVPDRVLAPFLPPGCVPDRWEGQGLASLVAFDFQDTRVKGVGVPGFRNFPEWNLRIYVRHGEDRGVAFVREYVPNPVVAGIARTVYGEPYRVAKFVSTREEGAGRFTITHRMRAEGHWHVASVEARVPPIPLPAEGLAPFLTEQQWGYGRTRTGRLLRYRVEHPSWRIYPVEDWNLSVDFARLYGRRWSCLQDAEPLSILLAEGSAVTVFNREVLPSA
jgi:hypothetical protein